MEAFRDHGNSGIKSYRARSLLKWTVWKSSQLCVGSITAELQASASINISTKTGCWELHSAGFHGPEAPVDVMCRQFCPRSALVRPTLPSTMMIVPVSVQRKY